MQAWFIHKGVIYRATRQGDTMLVESRGWGEAYQKQGIIPTNKSYHHVNATHRLIVNTLIAMLQPVTVTTSDASPTPA
jgi:hypothetical protein